MRDLYLVQIPILHKHMMDLFIKPMRCEITSNVSEDDQISSLFLSNSVYFWLESLYAFCAFEKAVL